MKTENKIIVALIILILLLLGAWLWDRSSLKADVAQAQQEVRLEKLRSAKLEKISSVQSRKIIADSLTQRDLNKRVKELGIALDAKPKIVWKTKFVIKEIEKEVDSIKIDSNSVEIEDFYPQKENYFIRYQNKIDLLTSKGVSNWSFNPIEISGAISQRKDGLYTIDFKHPDFLEIESIDVQATPLTVPKPDNFGILLGAGAGKDFRSGEVYGRISGGLRFKKIYVIVGGNTNQSVDGGVNFEF